MIYYSVTVDFITTEPYARGTLEEHLAEFIKDLGGKITATTIYIDEEADQ